MRFSVVSYYRSFILILRAKAKKLFIKGTIMFRKPTFSGPSLFSYTDAKGRNITVKKSDDDRLLGFLRNKKNTFSLFLEGGLALPDRVGRFLEGSSKGEDLSSLGIWFRFITFVLARKIVKAEVIFDSQTLTADNPFYSATRGSKCYICDAIGWRKPKVMFLYIHQSRSRSKQALAGGETKITFKHFFFPPQELPKLHQALRDNFRQN